ncbi:MAG: hypothetical protein AB2A00_36125 [Myxococcota bacterium]
MDWVIKLTVMLAAGLLARHVTVRMGRRLAERSTLRIPSLCTYATAGTVAALIRGALVEVTDWHALVIALVFGTVWGIIAGLGLPFARRQAVAPSRP